MKAIRYGIALIIALIATPFYVVSSYLQVLAVWCTGLTLSESLAAIEESRKSYFENLKMKSYLAALKRGNENESK